jgi:hypothetical protein
MRFYDWMLEWINKFPAREKDAASIESLKSAKIIAPFILKLKN